MFTYSGYQYDVAWADYNNQLIAPFLFSLTGIWVCIQIADIITEKYGDSKVLFYIGNNTWSIMMHHVFIYWLLKTIVFNLGAPNFDIYLHKTNIWYIYPFEGNYFKNYFLHIYLLRYR